MSEAAAADAPRIPGWYADQSRQWLNAILAGAGCDETTVAAALSHAALQADGWVRTALIAQVAPPVRVQLRRAGLCEEHAALPEVAVLPLLYEMTFARAAAAAEVLRPLRPADTPQPQLQLRPGPAATPAAPAGGGAPSAVVLVARRAEDVSWLLRLPAGASVHVCQKVERHPSLPDHCQTVLPDVGGEAHAYLSYIVAHYHALPELVVCARAEPFAHNPRFLDELTQIIGCAREHGADAVGFVPLGMAAATERIVHCDASGAPHEPTLLPIGSMWRSLFGSDARPPLWIGFVPGGQFAVPRSHILRRPCEWYARALAECGLADAADPVAARVFERLWRYIFDPACAPVEQHHLACGAALEAPTPMHLDAAAGATPADDAPEQDISLSEALGEFLGPGSDSDEGRQEVQGDDDIVDSFLCL